MFDLRRSLDHEKKSPPKSAIANGFAIGSIPPVISIKTSGDDVLQEIAVNEHNLTDCCVQL